MVWSPDVSNADIDIENDGLMNTQAFRAHIDLSHVASQLTGKQQSMMSVYRVGYLSLRLVNSNNGLDNNAGAAFGGQFVCHSPNKHNIKALKMLRKLHTADNKDSAQNMFTSTPEYKRYKGLRIEAYDVAPSATTIYKPSSIPTWTNAFGTTPNLQDLLNIYCETQPVDAADYENELWTTRTGVTQSIGWSASVINNMQNSLGAAGITYNPSNTGWEWTGEMDVLAGLLRCDITHSSTNQPMDVVDDDYHVEITVGLLGWSDF